MKTLSLIGPGRVGKALGRVLARSGSVRLLDVCGRSLAGAQAAVDFIGAGTAVDALVAMRPAEIYLLSVPDDAIAGASHALAQAGLPPGAVVFHCSGALTAETLHDLRAAGMHAASLHPVRSFADPLRVAEEFAGTCCGIEGDADAVTVVRAIFEASGATVFAIDGAGKTLYHAAAVFSSNYVVALIDVAMKTYGSVGIAPADALQLMAPLLREAAENAFRLGPAAALTGPISRGDFATVQRQQQALAAVDGGNAALYAALAAPTMRLADEQHALRVSLSPASTKKVAGPGSEPVPPT